MANFIIPYNVVFIPNMGVYQNEVDYPIYTTFLFKNIETPNAKSYDKF
jgi:hypothetical protein